MTPIAPDIFPIVGALQEAGIPVINAGPDGDERVFVFFDIEDARRASHLLMARAGEDYWYGYWQGGGGYEQRWTWTLGAGWFKSGLPERVTWSFPRRQLDALADVVAGRPIPNVFGEKDLKDRMHRHKTWIQENQPWRLPDAS